MEDKLALQIDQLRLSVSERFVDRVDEMIDMASHVTSNEIKAEVYENVIKYLQTINQLCTLETNTMIVLLKQQIHRLEI